ncbi:T9SS type A sorting domain-containing protein [Flavobacterium azooxidireducens]|uniref:T9SS type A sorting domain-containing protein n=1 Tax=Flavobacterium azooxidireducens TaxID=1871076 RepID=A0ABY4KFX5_9FLAO|nr:T9SS type A sorting domain-containing protein [Flavobacterium azooxidireducens]UPQ78295.1 T9SS type A sorting domain-containing protein [Flavobacterium azooxidireducens]
MKKHLHQLFSILFFLFSFITFSQDYQWQWAHRGGGNQNAGSNASWSSSLEQIFDVKIDQYNNYYFAGTVTNYNPVFMGESITKYGNNNIDTDIYIVSTDCEGNFRWHTTIGGHAGVSYVSIDLDNLGGLYISFTTGNFSRTNNTNVAPHYAPGVSLGYGTSNTPNPNNRSITLIKYDTDGNYLWHRMPQDENVTTVFTPGFFETRGLGYSLIVEPDGTIHWHCRFAPGNHLNGQLVVTEDVSEYHAILKYDKDGNYLSHIPLPFTGGAGLFQTKLYRDQLNTRYYFYITAVSSSGLEPTTWEGETLNTAGAVYALDVAGNELWRKVASSPSLRSATIWGLVTDEESNVYLTGSAGNQSINNLYASLAGYTFTHSFSSPYLIKLSPDGNLLWGTNLNPAEGSNLNDCGSCPGRSITINGDEVSMVGSLESNSWGNLTMPRAYGDGPAPVLVRFNKETGEPIAMNDIKDLLGVNSSEELMTVATELNGNYVVGGYARSTIFVNHPTIAPLTTNGGYSDFFIAKLGTGPCEPLSIDEPVKNKVKLYPNPTGGMLYIEAENLRSYAVYNLLGQELMKGDFNGNNNGNNNFKINMEGLSRGTYLVRLIGLDGVVITEKIIRD